MKRVFTIYYLQLEEMQGKGEDEVDGGEGERLESLKGTRRDNK